MYVCVCVCVCVCACVCYLKPSFDLHLFPTSPSLKNEEEGGRVREGGRRKIERGKGREGRREGEREGEREGGKEGGRDSPAVS